MPNFFISDRRIYSEGDVDSITGPDAFHISHTLRMKKGEPLTLTSSDGHEYGTVIEDFSKDEVFFKVITVGKNDTEPSVKARLFQALAKGDKMDTVIQKAVELGVYEIYPVESDRCIVHADEKKAEKKLERWNRIAYEASKQCGRGIIPKVHPIIDFDTALLLMKESDVYFICYETSRENNPKAFFRDKEFSSVAFFIGPEGGISPAEIERAHSLNIPDVTLGKLILRTETASGAVLSMLMYETQF